MERAPTPAENNFETITKENLLDFIQTDPTIQNFLKKNYINTPQNIAELDKFLEEKLLKVGDGRYRILDVDGESEDVFEQGGGGKVKLGIDTKLSKTVVIKYLTIHRGLLEAESFQKRFEKEAMAMAKSDAGRSIVHILDVAINNKKEIEAIIMEHIEGQDLFNFRNTREWKEEKTPEEKNIAVASIAMQICDALAYLHQDSRFIHRDIKLENIIINKNNFGYQVKLIDFGLALEINDEENKNDDENTRRTQTKEDGSEVENDKRRLTSDGEYMGTPQYIAPEIVRGEKSSDSNGRSDLYSLGVILYFLLRGRFPYHRRNKEPVHRLLDDKKNHVPCRKLTGDSEADQTLALVVDKLLQDEPDNRPPTALVLREIIKEAMIEAGYILKNESYYTWEKQSKKIPPKTNRKKLPAR